MTIDSPFALTCGTTAVKPTLKVTVGCLQAIQRID